MPATPHLDSTAIESGSPSDTAEKAWDAVLEALKPAKNDYNAAIRKLPQPWRAVYTTFWLQCEVNNGGHHQFFWNSDGALNAETQADLEFIGATPFLTFFTEARKIYDAHNYAEEKKSSGNTWEGFTAAYREKRMEELDTAFYKEPKNIETYLGEFIRSHPELFTK
ncbi:MAG: DUF4375 domain-containing protein [Verrucomicrobiaceae bacterium]